MKEKKTNLLQVLARRALLVALDGAIVAFSFYFALLLRADGAVEASWWPHNRALLYANLPWIVAVYLLSFLAGRLYTILWKYAGERDLIRLAGMIAVPTGIVYLVNRCFIHGVLFNSANAMAAVLIFLFIGAAVDVREISVDSGLIDAVSLILGGSGGVLVGVVALLFLVTLFGNMISWSMGVNSTAALAADHNDMPRVFAKRWAKNDMPVGAAVTSGVVASCVCVLGVLIEMASPDSSLFWSFFALHIRNLLL